MAKVLSMFFFVCILHLVFHRLFHLAWYVGHFSVWKNRQKDTTMQCMICSNHNICIRLACNPLQCIIAEDRHPPGEARIESSKQTRKKKCSTMQFIISDDNRQRRKIELWYVHAHCCSHRFQVWLNGVSLCFIFTAASKHKASTCTIARTPAWTTVIGFGASYKRRLR